jgi:hypothetical protein
MTVYAERLSDVKGQIRCRGVAVLSIVLRRLQGHRVWRRRAPPGGDRRPGPVERGEVQGGVKGRAIATHHRRDRSGRSLAKLFESNPYPLGRVSSPWEGAGWGRGKARMGAGAATRFSEPAPSWPPPVPTTAPRGGGTRDPPHSTPRRLKRSFASGALARRRASARGGRGPGSRR